MVKAPRSFEISTMLNVAINKILFRFLDLIYLKICLQLSVGCRRKSWVCHACFWADFQYCQHDMGAEP